jgi:hypothetical protein
MDYKMSNFELLSILKELPKEFTTTLFQQHYRIHLFKAHYIPTLKHAGLCPAITT